MFGAGNKLTGCCVINLEAFAQVTLVLSVMTEVTGGPGGGITSSEEVHPPSTSSRRAIASIQMAPEIAGHDEVKV